MSMSLRVARSAMRPSASMARFYSTPQDPKAKADSIIQAMPGTNYLSKTGVIATGAAASVYLISNGIYVVNGETLMVGAFFSVMYIMSRTLSPAYGAWAQGHVDTFRNTLNKARENHVAAVQGRIESVSQLKDVSTVTKDLFALSKDTVQLEAQAFERQQRVDFAHEAKAVLDSWVRYEGQVRQREQAELAQSVIAKIEKEIGNPKFKQQVLDQAVADVEKLFK